MTPSQRKQQTVVRPISYSGIGLHTGESVSLTFHPAPDNHGVVFRRIDLEGKPCIPAEANYVCDTSRNTTLGIGNTRIHTVEHVLAAVRGLELDNLLIDVEGVELPAGNGSSDVFVRMIEEAGIQTQNSVVKTLQLKNPIYWSEGEIHLVALPSEQYRISYTLSNPRSSILQGQYQSFTITPATFKQEIAPCRTFGLYEEIGPLIERGLINGCNLGNSVVIQDGVAFSKEGLFFPDEPVRHKILDLIGDLSLVGLPFTAHVIAIRSGHAAHRFFAKLLRSCLNSSLTKP